MRRFLNLAITGWITVALIGCAPEAFEPGDEPTTGTFDAIVSAAADPGGEGGEPDVEETAPAEAPTARIFSGSVTTEGAYQLFELGNGRPGDEWAIDATGPLSSAFVVVLLDADKNLLMRTFLSFANPLRHTLRDATDQVYLGVMPPSSGNGGNFSLRAALRTSQAVPGPAAQLVWLNFEGGSDVRVHRGDAISFPRFDAAVIGDAYAGHTEAMKAVILEEMRIDYASYNVTVLSSDDGPAPDEPHSVVHFGGGQAGLLGLADNVDNYNRDPAQDAIVYVENFAPYWTMQLEPDEMAVMIANVASHEAGHLLGLYHTQDPNDLMDTTGTAWELAENQSFLRGRLESSVFAIGWEDSPRLLAQIVGENPASAAKALARKKSPKAEVYTAVRRFARRETAGACGTCLSLDHE